MSVGATELDAVVVMLGRGAVGVADALGTLFVGIPVAVALLEVDELLLPVALLAGGALVGSSLQALAAAEATSSSALRDTNALRASRLRAGALRDTS